MAPGSFSHKPSRVQSRNCAAGALGQATVIGNAKQTAPGALYVAGRTCGLAVNKSAENHIDTSNGVHSSYLHLLSLPSSTVLQLPVSNTAESHSAKTDEPIAWQDLRTFGEAGGAGSPGDSLVYRRDRQSLS